MGRGAGRGAARASAGQLSLSKERATGSHSAGAATPRAKQLLYVRPVLTHIRESSVVILSYQRKPSALVS